MTLVYGTFEDLDLYKQARTFRKNAYQLTAILPAEEKYGLASQMRRAAVSITKLRITSPEDMGGFITKRTFNSCGRPEDQFKRLSMILTFA